MNDQSPTSRTRSRKDKPPVVELLSHAGSTSGKLAHGDVRVRRKTERFDAVDTRAKEEYFPAAIGQQLGTMLERRITCRIGVLNVGDPWHVHWGNSG